MNITQAQLDHLGTLHTLMISSKESYDEAVKKIAEENGVDASVLKSFVGKYEGDREKLSKEIDKKQQFIDLAEKFTWEN